MAMKKNEAEKHIVKSEKEKGTAKNPMQSPPNTPRGYNPSAPPSSIGTQPKPGTPISYAFSYKTKKHETIISALEAYGVIYTHNDLSSNKPKG